MFFKPFFKGFILTHLFCGSVTPSYGRQDWVNFVFKMDTVSHSCDIRVSLTSMIVNHTKKCTFTLKCYFHNIKIGCLISKEMHKSTVCTRQRALLKPVLIYIYQFQGMTRTRENCRINQIGWQKTNNKVVSIFWKGQVLRVHCGKGWQKLCRTPISSVWNKPKILHLNNGV